MLTFLCGCKKIKILFYILCRFPDIPVHGGKVPKLKIRLEKGTPIPHVIKT